MKKLLLIPFLLSGFILLAQQHVVFKIKYLPGHNYEGAITMNVAANITLSGDSAVLSKIQSQGLTQPLVLNIDMKMGGNSKTGKVGSDKTFPIAMTYKVDNMSMDMNGNNVPVPAEKLGKSVTVFGHVGPDSKIKADSIGGVKVADTSQEQAAKLMNTIQKQIKFPDHAMQIGESFSQEMPMNIPIGGTNMDVKSQVTYKLISIVDGNANFDVLQSLDMNIPIAGSNLNLNGSGGGKMIYNIKDSFATDYDSKMSLKATGDIKTLKIDATAQMNMEYKYVVTAN